MPSSRSLYDVLNIAPEAEPVVVEAAYKALIKKYHPDQAVETPVSRDAAAINEAFAVLKDPARRADYDHRLWTKQQALRLAELKAGSLPRPRAAALGGWLVAGLLACALAAVALGKSLAPPPLTSAAEAAEPQDSEGPARAAAAKAAAAEAAHDRLVMPSSAAVIARVRAEQQVRSLRRAPPARGASTVRYRKPRPVAPAQDKSGREKDFLERQGYIY